MSVSSIGPTTQNVPLPPAPQKAAAPAESSAAEATEKSSKPEAVVAQASSQNTPNPALKVNSDGTIGPHHKARHPHASTQSAASAAQPQRQPETLPGSIKV